MLELMHSKNHFAKFGLFSIILLMSVVLIAVMFLKKPNSELNLDTRKEAMVDSGLVELDTYPFNQSTLKVAEKQNINLQINTKDKSINSVKLIFEIIADDGLLNKDKIAFTGSIPDEMKVDKQEIVESICNEDCYTVTLSLSLKDSVIPFATHEQMETVSELSFTPQKEGSLKIKISQDSTAIESESNSDVLQKPSVLDFQYYVTRNGIDRAQCYYEYTSWGECKNGWQTRQYSVKPDNCYWYKSDTLDELSQKCTNSDTISANNAYFYLYSNDKCLNQASTGESLYIIWNDDQYDNVTWVDVSTDSAFANFYHKKVEGNINQRNGDWIMLNATGFTDVTASRGTLAIQPNTTYFFRLYSTDHDGQHISSVRYYVTYCSGDQSSYKNCNDACGENSDQSKKCAPGLTCHENLCRNEDNLNDSSCLPVLGIKNSEQSCNEYCSNNNDCAAGLSCYWNHCRNPLNLSSNSCQKVTSSSITTQNKTALLPSESYDLATHDCNQGCNNNRDCNADLRCYKGSCRLADDPENASCVLEAADKKEASQSGDTANIKASASPSPESEKPAGFQINLGEILANFSWQWLVIAGGILLTAISLIIASISKAKKDPWTSIEKEEKTEIDKTIEIPEDKPLKF